MRAFNIVLVDKDSDRLPIANITTKRGVSVEDVEDVITQVKKQHEEDWDVFDIKVRLLSEGLIDDFSYCDTSINI